MALELRDQGDLFLNPSDQFLSEEHRAVNLDGFRFSWSGTDLSSFESKSTDQSSTDEEDDEYISELTRQMAHYMLQDDDQHDLANIGSEASEEQHKAWGVIGSKEQLPSSMSSPDDVVGRIEKMELDKEWPKLDQNQRFLGKSRKPNSVPVDSEKPKYGSLSDYQICSVMTRKQQRAANWRTRDKKSQNLEPKQVSQNLHSKNSPSGFGARPQYLSPYTWPALPPQQNLQHPTGSGMRGVFLDGSGSRSGSCGTGFFLPRGINSPSEPRKKPGCSTVLIPARVVHALKLHFEQGAASRSGAGAGAFPVQHHDASLGGDDSSGSDDLVSHPKHQHHTTPAMNQYEMRLPQEWTY